jgi:hypothetical protein
MVSIRCHHSPCWRGRNDRQLTRELSRLEIHFLDGRSARFRLLLFAPSSIQATGSTERQLRSHVFCEPPLVFRSGWRLPPGKRDCALDDGLDLGSVVFWARFASARFLVDLRTYD